jgi:hypothetical protein
MKEKGQFHALVALPLKKEMPIPTPVRRRNLVVKRRAAPATGVSRITTQHDYPNSGLAVFDP